LDEAISHAEGKEIARTKKVKFKAGRADSVEKESLNIIISGTPDYFLIGYF